jgi:molecular chaperone GrpE
MEESQEMQEDDMKAEEQSKAEEGLIDLNSQIADLETQLAQARQEANDNWNKYLRERAEIENFRKRQERLAADRVAREKKQFIHKILDVQDNVERALVYQETMDKQALQHTLRMLSWQLTEVLRGEGLTAVASVGTSFDPYLHEAIEVIEDSDQPEGTVIEEVLKGYKIGDDVLRHARVKVSAPRANGNQE